MDIKIKWYLERAENELILAKTTLNISTDNEIKNILAIPNQITFFNNVISQSYFAIFYSAKAYLIQRSIQTEPPEEHKKTYEEFKKIFENKKLIEIYEEETNKAETLLKIFIQEKSNRARFTYKMNANANKPFAEQSIKNAIFFATTIKQMIEKESK